MNRFQWADKYPDLGKHWEGDVVPNEQERLTVARERERQALRKAIRDAQLKVLDASCELAKAKTMARLIEATF